MILSREPGFLRVQIGRGRVTPIGETAPEGPSGADFVAYLDSIVRWDAPHESEPLNPDDVRRITATVEAACKAKGLAGGFE